MKCSASVVSVRGKVATGGEGVESVLRVLQALHCIECASSVFRGCRECASSGRKRLKRCSQAVAPRSTILQGSFSFSVIKASATMVLLSWVLIKGLKRCSQAVVPPSTILQFPSDQCFKF